MPHKIAFVVVSSSGHEDGYSAKELEVHAPTVGGWRSPRFCSYPQEIVFQMVEPCRIRKLQLLAHQYMISSKIEFFVSSSLPEYFTTYRSDRFRRLGYVSLSDNEKTGFKARELKSIHLDAVGQYLKLTFHKNYVNRYNLYNQVAIVAVNVLGDPVDYNDINNFPAKEKLIDQYLGHSPEDPALNGTYIGKPDALSPLDDLAFDMYQDPEVAQIIRKLDEKKQEAVRAEQYEYAKKLKQAIADLQKVGERLGRYEVEKRCAVDKEDYDLAQQKKFQMDEYRMKVYQQLELHSLLDMGVIRRPAELQLEPLNYPSNSKPTESPRQKTDRLPEKPIKPLSEEQQPRSISPKPVATHRTQTSPTSSSPLQHTVPKINIESLPYDERPLPALRKQQEDMFGYLEPEPKESIPSDTPRNGITGEPEPLTEKALREASMVIEVFGEALVAGAYSKTWSYREDALLAVYKKLMEEHEETSKDELKSMLRAAVFLIQRAVKDKVSSVFQVSLKLMKMIITHYIPKHKLGKVETTHCVERVLPLLISKTGETTSGLRVTAINFIQEMALLNEVRPLQIVPAQLVAQPLKRNTPKCLALSQVQLLEHLLKELGTQNSGFTTESVMTFVAHSLEHVASEVRDIAVRIILDMYKKHRGAILSYLPQDDAYTRKNVLYKTLFDGFAKIDGRPTEAESKVEKKAAAEQAEKQKKEEIRALQEQLAALKDIQAEVQSGKVREKAVEAQKVTKSDDRGKKTSPAPPTELSSDHSPDPNYFDNLCIFCSERDEAFTAEGLDIHYWKYCPVLKRCEHCKQVVEIASLTDHLLTECDKKEGFGKCLRCSEAIPKEELTEHVRSKSCNPAKPEKVANRCPLCHENFSPGEEAWKSHLMGRDGCKMNPRRIHSIQRTQLMQQGKPGGLAVNKPGVTGTKGRSPSVASKIPALKAGPNKTTSKTPVRR